eukprot:SAG11_NODE_33977_length_274_cov_0.885714_1_plen_39_part_10
MPVVGETGDYVPKAGGLSFSVTVFSIGAAALPPVSRPPA